MKKAIFEKACQMKIADVDRPTIEKPDDVIIKVVRTCVCGCSIYSWMWALCCLSRGIRWLLPKPQ